MVKRRIASLCAWCGGLIILAGGVLAAAPDSINFQGRLLDINGQIVSTNVTMEVKLFAEDTGGAPVYYEWIGPVPVQNSLYSFTFGTNTPAFQDALTNEECWLELVVEGVALIPRQRLTSVPYALDSARLAGAPASQYLTTDTSFGGDVAGTYDQLALRSDLTGVLASRYGPPGQAALESALQAADPAVETLLVLDQGEWALTNNLSIPDHITLRFLEGSLLAIPPTVTLNFADCAIEDTMGQIFQGSGVIAGRLNNEYIRPEWWGAKALPFWASAENLMLYYQDVASNNVKAFNWMCDFTYGNGQPLPELRNLEVRLMPWAYVINSTIYIAPDTTWRGSSGTSISAAQFFKPDLETAIRMGAVWLVTNHSAVVTNSGPGQFGSDFMVVQRSNRFINHGSHAVRFFDLCITAGNWTGATNDNLSCLFLTDAQERTALSRCVIGGFTRYGVVFATRGYSQYSHSANFRVEHCSFSPSRPPLGCGTSNTVCVVLGPITGGTIEFDRCTFSPPGSAIHAPNLTAALTLTGCHIENDQGVTISGGSLNMIGCSHLMYGTTDPDRNARQFSLRIRKIDDAQGNNANDTKYGWPCAPVQAVATNGLGLVDAWDRYQANQWYYTHVNVQNLFVIEEGVPYDDARTHSMIVDEWSGVKHMTRATNASPFLSGSMVNRQTTITSMSMDNRYNAYDNNATSHWVSTHPWVTDMAGTPLAPRMPLTLISDLWQTQMASRVTGLLASNEVAVAGLVATGDISALTLSVRDTWPDGSPQTVPFVRYNSDDGGWTLCGIEDFVSSFSAKLNDAPGTGGPWARQSNTWTPAASTAAVAAAQSTGAAAYALAQTALVAASNAQARADLGLTNGQDIVGREYQIINQETGSPVLFAEYDPSDDGWHVAGRANFGGAMAEWDAKIGDAPGGGGTWARQSNQWVRIDDGDGTPAAYLAAYNGTGATDGGYPSIGMAWSFNGRFFLKGGDNPTVSTNRPAPADWKPVYVAQPWLVQDNLGLYRLYYYAHAGSTAYIAMSTSPNGRDWQDYGPLVQDWGTFPVVRQMSPNQWQMWTYGQGRIWYAFGTNGINWSFWGAVWAPENLPWTTFVLPGGAISVGDQEYLFFSGNTVTSGMDAADIGLLKIGDPYYTAMNDGNPILTRRTNAYGLLLQDVAEGARTIRVANASAFALLEPVQIGDMVTEPGIYQVQEISSPTSLVLKTSLRSAYTVNATGCVVSVMQASLCPRTVQRVGDHYVLYVTAYNLSPYAVTSIQREYTVRATAPDILGPWNWDYEAGVVLSVGPEGDWDSSSAENITVLPVPMEDAMGAAMATFQAIEQLQRRVENLERLLDVPP